MGGFYDTTVCSRMFACLVLATGTFYGIFGGVEPIKRIKVEELRLSEKLSKDWLVGRENVIIISRG